MVEERQHCQGIPLYPNVLASLQEIAKEPNIECDLWCESINIDIFIKDWKGRTITFRKLPDYNVKVPKARKFEKKGILFFNEVFFRTLNALRFSDKLSKKE